MLTSLTNIPRDYDWGSKTLLAGLRGDAPARVPEAEVWFGDHPGSLARVADGRTLDVALAEEGVGSLPYLLKLLAAEKSLSIQVHPSKEQAIAGFAGEANLGADDPTRNYQDDNHKPELIVALSERFEALAGLRDPEATVALLGAFGSLRAAAELSARLRAGAPADALRESIAWLLSDAGQPAAEAISTALPEAHSEAFAAELEVLRRIAETFPGDRGIVVALLMNLVVLRRGEGLFLRAGLLHTYQRGLGVEIMAASDNVLRGGLTPKRIDVPELLRLTDTTPGEVPVLHPVAVADGMASYGPGVADFALAVASPHEGAVTVPVAGPTTLLCTAGAVRAEADGQTLQLRPGQAAIAAAPLRKVRLVGDGEVFIATPGESPSL